MNSIATQAAPTTLSELIIQTFQRLFWREYQTELTCGGDEPLYVPRSATQPCDRIIFARGFWSSALHEVAHWCIAGPERRRQLDYGYWYAPDGRNQQEQELFERCEVKPQALEWLFTSALGERFYVSFDNLNGERSDSRRFRKAVREQALAYLSVGLPKRAGQFLTALLQKKSTNDAFNAYWQQVREQGILPA
ncbi:MAG: elongation factor P hydroxylase [Oligoflexus sp.]